MRNVQLQLIIFTSTDTTCKLSQHSFCSWIVHYNAGSDICTLDAIGWRMANRRALYATMQEGTFTRASLPPKQRFRLKYRWLIHHVIGMVIYTFPICVRFLYVNPYTCYRFSGLYRLWMLFGHQSNRLRVFTIRCAFINYRLCTLPDACK